MEFSEVQTQTEKCLEVEEKSQAKEEIKTIKKLREEKEKYFDEECKIFSAVEIQTEQKGAKNTGP